MPGTPPPAGEGPNRLPVIWNAVTQKLQELDRRLTAIEGARQTNIIDRDGNTIIVIGQLLQTVTIGASNTGTPIAGVTVQTILNLPPAGQPLVGIAVQYGLATGTMTFTQGSSTATLVSTTSSNTFTVGQAIGAALVTDPTTGVATSAVQLGTTISGIPGLGVITLSQPAAESGTGLYTAAAFWNSLNGFTYP